MKVISDLNDPSWASKIRSVICCRGGNKFQFMRGQEYFDIKIEKAPEPEDILWTNLAVPTKEYVKRKLITYSVTFILLGISFAIVFGLSRAQQSNSNNQILSLAISVFISVINIVLSIVIRKLSIYEKEYTTTKYQTSLALKSIFASLVNSILIPIIVNYYIKQDLYGKNGLASDIFMLGVTNAFIAPILKIIDISYIINRIMKYIASRPSSRLKTNQDELNGSYEYLNFEIGQEYEYLITLFLCNCFFVSLQPIIPFFGCLGLGLMYWVQKYSLLNKMKRPIPGTDHVNIVMSQLILLGGITYSLGSMTWSNFMPNGINSAATWIPNLIALGFGILMALLPYRTIIASCSAEVGAKNLVFQEKRMILSSEYDRLNPSTSAEALKQFQDFYENKMKKLSQGSAEQKTRFMNQMAKNKGRGHQRPQQQMMMMSGMPSPYMPMQMYGYGGSPFMMSSYGYGYGSQPYQYQQPLRQQPMQSSVIQPTMQQSGMKTTMVQSVNNINIVPNQPQQQSVVNQQQQQQQQQQLLLKQQQQQQLLLQQQQQQQAQMLQSMGYRMSTGYQNSLYPYNQFR